MNPKSESERDRARRVAEFTRRYGKSSSPMTPPNPEAAAILDEMRKRPSYGDPPPVPTHHAASNIFDEPADLYAGMGEAGERLGRQKEQQMFDAIFNTPPSPFDSAYVVGVDQAKSSDTDYDVIIEKMRLYSSASVPEEQYDNMASPGVLWPFYKPPIHDPPPPPGTVIDATFRIIDDPAPPTPPALKTFEEIRNATLKRWALDWGIPESMMNPQPDPIQKLLDGPTEK